MVDTMHKEQSVVKDNGIEGAYRINYDFINTKAYHDKFEKLTGHKAVNEAMYKCATKMLERRSGTKYEDIAMLDAHTGEILVENIVTNGKNIFMTGLTREQTVYLDNLNNEFEILHNHPGSSMPSLADIEGLFNRKKAVASTIICHDGTLYRMEKLKQIDDIEALLNNACEEIKSLYSTWTKNRIFYVTVEQVLKRLQRSEHIRFRKE